MYYGAGEPAPRLSKRRLFETWVMKLNSFFFAPAGYNPPLPADDRFSTPQNLAELLVYDNRFQLESGGSLASPLSEDGIRRLVDLVFYASMSPEEGRFLRFKVATTEGAGSSFSVARFDPVPLHSPDVIRRLAPACTHPECALVIVEREGGLFCDGVTNVGPMGYEWMPGYPGIAGVGRPPMYLVTVRDPGHLITDGSYIGASYELRAGKIRPLSPYWAPAPVEALHREFAGHLKSEIIQRAGSDAATLFGGVDGSPQTGGFFNMLSRILRVAVEARHGGAFVILPSGCDPKTFQIDIKYPASDLDLGLDVVNFWIACVEYLREEPKSQSLLRRCTVLRTKMLTDAEAVGNLSGVDGCVVLDRRLQLCGFGGVISVSEEAAQQSVRAFRNVKSGEEWGYNQFMKEIGGTRHKSAARLCKVHPGVLVFVVSQDGDLKSFCSDDRQINAFGPLDLPLLGDPLY
jgi:hypothetical protein